MTPIQLREFAGTLRQTELAPTRNLQAAVEHIEAAAQALEEKQAQLDALMTRDGPEAPSPLTADKAPPEDKASSVTSRIRQEFDSRYGELAGVMRAILTWRSRWEDYRTGARDPERRITDVDVGAAEADMLLAVRRYAAGVSKEHRSKDSPSA